MDNGPQFISHAFEEACLHFAQRFQKGPVSCDPMLIAEYTTLLEQFKRRIPNDLDELIAKMKRMMKLQALSKRTQKAYVNHSNLCEPLTQI
jgi:hypothetical protein